MIVRQHHNTDTTSYWLAEQSIQGRVYLAEADTMPGALSSMYALICGLDREAVEPSEAAELIGYSRCMLDWKYGAAVWERNPYPVGTPEYTGWKTAVSVLADRVRMQA